jgi:SAM-dependent methyltransferase
MAAALLVVGWAAGPSAAQTATQPAPSDTFQPQVGQPGKDVVWVPTPEVLVERMLDLAKVGPSDIVVDLGSGDGRNVIAAAKRGARARGVEFNPNMVALSRRLAAQAGVSDRAQFIEGDMFTADFSDATVMALFLLPDNMLKLRDKFLALEPGSRIVANTFGIEGWEPDVREQVGEGCTSWCTALLWIVPAQVGGTWRTPQGTIRLEQRYQMLTGAVNTGSNAAPITEGRVRGRDVEFTAGGVSYTGTLGTDGRLQGTISSGGRWEAVRAQP